MKTTIRNSITLFFVLAVIFIPFSFDLFPFQVGITATIFGSLTEWIADVLQVKVVLRDFSSDSTLLWILITILFSISLVSTTIFRHRNHHFYEKYKKAVFMVLIGYLLVVTAKYGFDKIFFTQFYNPNPNILATPLGNLDQDIAFWSIIGANKGINIFMGLAELVPSLLILIPKTRKVALLMLIGVYTTVFTINICFDISVKLFSCFLLILSIFLWYESSKIDALPTTPRRTWSFVTPVIILGLMLSEGLYRHTLGKTSSALPNKTFFIESCEINGEPQVWSRRSLKALHVHRDEYLIFEDYTNEMTSFKFKLDSTSKTIKLNDGTAFTYELQGSKLILQQEQVLLRCRLKEKPYALERQDFHLTVDSYQ